MAETKVVVRDATREDEPAILELYRATPELHRNAVVDLLDEDEREYAWKDDCKIFLVAVGEGGNLLGFVYVKIKHKTIHEEKARILHCAVNSNARRSDVGTRLLQEVRVRLREQRIDMVYAVTNEKNLVFRMFLRQHGFKEVGHYVRCETELSSNDFHPLTTQEMEDLGYYEDN